MIEMHVVGSDAARGGLQQLLGDERRGRARLNWSASAKFEPRQILGHLPAEGAKIHCWIDLSDPRLAHLYFVVPTHDRFMMRDLALERLGNFEFESLAQIIELSLDVLLTDAQAGITRQQAQSILIPDDPRSPPRAEPEVRPRSAAEAANPASQARLRFGVAARYTVTHYSGEFPVQHGPGVSLALERQLDRGLKSVALSGNFYLPQRIRNETASASIGYSALALDLRQLWALDPVHWIGPRLGLGLGVVQAKPFAGDLAGKYELSSQTRTPEFYLCPGLTWRIDLASRLSIQSDLSLGLVPKPVRHEFVVDGRERVLTQGLLFRPAFSAELLVH